MMPGRFRYLMLVSYTPEGDTKRDTTPQVGEDGG
jgi:hypothetical protein